MTNLEFEEFLHAQIPITKTMKFSIMEFTPSRIRVSATLEANKNHMGTAFGGSINSLMTVCGWVMTHININNIDEDAHVVLQKSNINYLAPITEDFIAECILINEEERINFIEKYNETQKSKLKLKVSCYNGKTLAAEFEGQYVAFK